MAFKIMQYNIKRIIGGKEFVIPIPDGWFLLDHPKTEIRNGDRLLNGETGEFESPINLTDQPVQLVNPMTVAQTYAAIRKFADIETVSPKHKNRVRKEREITRDGLILQTAYLAGEIARLDTLIRYNNRPEIKAIHMQDKLRAQIANQIANELIAQIEKELDDSETETE